MLIKIAIKDGLGCQELKKKLAGYATSLCAEVEIDILKKYDENKSYHYDLFFCPCGEDNLTFAYLFRSRCQCPVIVWGKKTDFTASIFPLHPVVCLPYPFDIESFVSAMRKYCQDIWLRSFRRLILSPKKPMNYVYHVEIRYIQSENHGCILHCSPMRDCVTVGYSLQMLQNALGDNFLRCHKRYIIHARYILHITNQQIELKDGTKFALSDSYVETVLPKWEQYQKSIKKFL